MAELLELDEEIREDEEQQMGSLNHGIVQGQIIVLLSADKRFRVIPELSLDVSQIDLTQFDIKAKKELIPDICVYPNTIKRQRRDVLRMTEMPLLAIEIVSPLQAIEEILAKFDAYFALGIKSCWLVVLTNEATTIYSEPEHFKTFGTNDVEIIDEVMDIHLPNRAIFEL
ncbi:Uma2 family endonuclease [Candidatus Parabeggiatoa sp. HSG14]|uniref:Uma2 family endonuclease n=1 Tax=Candidatus Parabeggiatoa sp. HSG14 TaxID=3055593 RepID=UPI0025A77506|nr:Uma2 family endonuclease [Thiotrichales bacterium HSG14]